MDHPADELRALSVELLELVRQGEDASATEPVERLERSAAAIAKAWSGSSIGFHSCVYYADFKRPPPGAHFSQEWGFLGQFQGTTGDWRQYAYDDVYDLIFEQAGNPALAAAEALSERARRTIERAGAAFDSIVSGVLEDRTDAYLAKLRDRSDELVVLDSSKATELQVDQGPIMTRDTTALGQGRRAAPHQAVLGLVISYRSPLTTCGDLADILQHAATHLERKSRRDRREQVRESGSFVFIGHGRSPLWYELKAFVAERLGLQCDEFNRVPVAGVTNVERLLQMLDDAGIALLVLTAEDETAEGSVLARQNVVHEAGLFQGRLGFTRAILLLEEGCAEFSNIAGLGQIRFPVGNIQASFEEVRRVLEREGLI